MVEINGAYGEGGGQILRSSLTLSALTGKRLHIHHIRSGRSKPGLRPQHLTAVQAIKRISNGDLQGDEINSQELTLIPHQNKPGRFEFNIPTAGAASLVLQTVFLPLSFQSEKSEITLTGGTHVPWSPVFHYLQEQWLPWMQKIGYRSTIELKKAGFYPEGGGEIRVTVFPHQPLHPIRCLERGELVRIRGVSGVANLDDSIAKRQKHQALRRLYVVCRDSKIQTIRMPAQSKGTFLLVTAEFSEGGRACYFALGELGKLAERVADDAIDQLIAFLESDGFVDQYLADQLLLPLSLIEGFSEFSTSQITQHLLTNAHVIRQFLPVEIQILGEINQPGKIIIRNTAFQ
jgi:RNA 3'-terminal phosphate cyclase (ATP)